MTQNKSSAKREMSPQRQTALELLRKFPKAGNHTLSRIAVRDYPEVFLNLESARAIFRSIRGAKGKGHKPVPGCERKIVTPRDPFAGIPEGKTYFDHWGPYEVGGRCRVLVISDLHIPYHDKTAIVASLQWAKKNAVDTILLNGDVADFFAVSFWQNDPRKRDFAGELKACREFFDTLRKTFPKARIIYKSGNHEFRWSRWLYVKAPEVLGVDDFEIPSLLQLDGVEYIADTRPVALGDLNVLHGHEYRFAISNPVNPARGLFLRCKAHAMCGHFHQPSYHSERTVEQQNIATWSLGCLCDLHPEYSPYNNWAHSFACVDVESDGRFEVQHKYIGGGGRIY
jgi:predicted phosphodiesterase